MRKTTIKTQVTFTDIVAIGFNTDSNKLEDITITIPATAKTEKGIEKLVQENVRDNIKIVKIVSYNKFSVWYEMDRETFLKYAVLANEK